jgi:hypothetical protein
MAKNITEIFTLKLHGSNYHIEARSFNEHHFSIDAEKCHPITTIEMRMLANHILETADKIDNENEVPVNHTDHIADFGNMLFSGI